MHIAKPIDPRKDYGDGLDKKHLNIIECTKRNDLDGVKLCLEQRPECSNDTDRSGMNALHWAIHHNNIHIVQTLLEADPPTDYDKKDDFGRSAAEFAVQYAINPEIIDLISKIKFPEFFDPDSEWNSDNPPQKVVDFPKPDSEP